MVLRFFYNQLWIIIGSILSALGFSLFQVPFDLAAGGVTGIAIIINKYTALNVGTLYLIMNIPLLIWGYFKLGKFKFVSSTLLAVFLFGIFSDIFIKYLPGAMKVYPVSNDLLLNSIYAGILFGIGMGLIQRAGGTLGGTAVPARVIQQKTGFPLSQSYLITDISVIVMAGFVFSWEKAMLAILSLVLAGMFSDYVLEGVSQVRTAMIITKVPDEMSKTLMTELQRGVSTWSIKGGYTGRDNTMIYCTVRRPQVGDLKFIVSKVDPDAFLVIGTAQQAYGGVGFAHLKAPKA